MGAVYIHRVDALCLASAFMKDRYELVLQLARLFAKLPWSGDSEVTFAVIESSCHLLLPV